MARRQRLVGFVIAVIVVAFLIQFFGWYFPQHYGQTDTRLVAQALYIGVAAMGLNVLTGYNGQVSIGHGAFFGVGAYTTALLMDHEYTWLGVTFGHTSFLATLPVVAVVTFVVGALVGFPALRVKGLYLALVTLGLAVIFPDLATRFVKGTGGTSLVSLPPSEVAAPSWFPSRFSAQDQWAYYNAFVFAVVGLLVIWLIARSRFGRSLIAVRDHEAAAASVGSQPRPHEGARVRVECAVRRYRRLAVGARRFAGQCRQGADVPDLDRVPGRARHRRHRHRDRPAPRRLRGRVHRQMGQGRVPEQAGRVAGDLRRRLDPAHVRASRRGRRGWAPTLATRAA